MRNYSSTIILISRNLKRKVTIFLHINRAKNAQTRGELSKVSSTIKISSREGERCIFDLWLDVFRFVGMKITQTFHFWFPEINIDEEKYFLNLPKTWVDQNDKTNHFSFTLNIINIERKEITNYDSCEYVKNVTKPTLKINATFLMCELINHIKNNYFLNICWAF